MTLKEIINQRKIQQQLNTGNLSGIVVDMISSSVNQKLKEIDFEEIVAEKVQADISSVIRAGLKGERGNDGQAIRGPKGDPGVPGKDADEVAIVKTVLKKIPPPEKGKDGRDGKDGSPDTPKQIVDKLNTQRESVKMDVVEGLTKEIEKLKKNLKETKRGNSARGGGGGTITYTEDLSSQCDGNTKTFTVPSHKRVLFLLATDFPRIYRPTVDFTTTGTSLTLTSEVAAPLSGATLLFCYVV